MTRVDVPILQMVQQSSSSSLSKLWIGLCSWSHLFHGALKWYRVPTAGRTPRTSLVPAAPHVQALLGLL